MKSINEEHFELVAKRCPSCNALVQAKTSGETFSEGYYSDYQCSECAWISPKHKNTATCR